MTLALLGLLACSEGAFTQNFGIGTNKPTLAKLQVDSSVGRTVAIFGGDGNGISLMRNNPAIGFNLYSNGTLARALPKAMGMGPSLFQSLNSETGTMALNYFATNSGPNTDATNDQGRLTIRSNGNVTINGGEGNSSLSVFRPPSPFSSCVVLRGTSYDSYFMGDAEETTSITGGKFQSDVLINDIAALGNVFIGDDRCKVGINRSTPKATLEIGQLNNRGLMLINTTNNSNWEFAGYKNQTLAGSDYYIFFNGSYRGNFFHVDGDYYKISDGRFKTGISPLPSVLQKVMQLKPVSYHFTNEKDANPMSIGFIAQDVASIFPELVQSFPNDSTGYAGIEDLLMLSYDDFGPIAIKALQEQQAQIKTMEARNAAIRHRVQVLKSKLASLETENSR